MLPLRFRKSVTFKVHDKCVTFKGHDKCVTFQGHDKCALLPAELSKLESGDDVVRLDDVDEVLLLVDVDLAVVEGHDHRLEALTLVVYHLHGGHAPRELYSPQLLTLGAGNNSINNTPLTLYS